jgi:mannobiose 2-epimerase
MAARAAVELRTDILPFWERHVFVGDDWMVGEVGDDLTIRDDVARHCVIVARMLWAFAAAARQEEHRGRRERWIDAGRRAYRILTGPCWDRVGGGVFWSLRPDRTPLSDRKQVYAQAFAIYGLVEWHAATRERAPIERAMELFDAIEEHSRDRTDGGYIEAHSAAWGVLRDTRLSERDLKVPKSMNTNLHVLEAYTKLAMVTRDPRVLAALSDLLTVHLDHIVLTEPWYHCALYFNEKWRSQTPNISWGHDIEASWLLWEAATVVGNAALTARTREATLGLADAVLAHGVDPDGSVLYEGTPTQILEPEKYWWPQAEGVVGWLNAYGMTGEKRYRDAALKAWAFIETYMIDRNNGEWFSVLSRDGKRLPLNPASKKMGPWKCPYHNTRACLEIMRRVTG